MSGKPRASGLLLAKLTDVSLQRSGKRAAASSLALSELTQVLLVLTVHLHVTGGCQADVAVCKVAADVPESPRTPAYFRVESCRAADPEEGISLRGEGSGDGSHDGGSEWRRERDRRRMLGETKATREARVAATVETRSGTHMRGHDL